MLFDISVLCILYRKDDWYISFLFSVHVQMYEKQVQLARQVENGLFMLFN